MTVKHCVNSCHENNVIKKFVKNKMMNILLCEKSGVPYINSF
jgi:hypothetical protein